MLYYIQKEGKQMKEYTPSWDLEFYALIQDFSSRKFVPYNIFNNARFQDGLDRIFEDGNDYQSLNEFIEQLRRLLHSCFWSKCEYEVFVTDILNRHSRKIDVYQQVLPNIRLLAFSILGYAIGHKGINIEYKFE